MRNVSDTVTARAFLKYMAYTVCDRIQGAQRMIYESKISTDTPKATVFPRLWSTSTSWKRTLHPWENERGCCMHVGFVSCSLYNKDAFSRTQWGFSYLFFSQLNAKLHRDKRKTAQDGKICLRLQLRIVPRDRRVKRFVFGTGKWAEASHLHSFLKRWGNSVIWWYNDHVMYVSKCSWW